MRTKTMIMLFDTNVSVCPLHVVALLLNKTRAFHDFFIGKLGHLVAITKLHFSKTNPNDYERHSILFISTCFLFNTRPEKSRNHSTVFVQSKGW